ncbi:hypothetical protein ABEB36_011554 [Hypothenemus hampei]|uniref:Uncharacterized protein n=1 Tax=Hypothenemus hampei TaxID=57062 RepID=A0ABD1E877_HYPHA
MDGVAFAKILGGTKTTFIVDERKNALELNVTIPELRIKYAERFPKQLSIRNHGGIVQQLSIGLRMDHYRTRQYLHRIVNDPWRECGEIEDINSYFF